jgi:hypothetical protein
MKGKKHHKAEGGPAEGDNDAEKDVRDDPEDRSAPNKVAKEAEERKHGGRAKRKHGGKVHVGAVEGEKAKHHAGRMPRKSGGRTGSNMNPLSSAHSGTAAPGRKEMSESMD